MEPNDQSSKLYLHIYFLPLFICFFLLSNGLSSPELLAGPSDPPSNMLVNNKANSIECIQAMERIIAGELPPENAPVKEASSESAQQAEPKETQKPLVASSPKKEEDTKIVDGVLYVNGQPMPTYEEERLGIGGVTTPSPNSAKTKGAEIKVIDGVLYLNGQLASLYQANSHSNDDNLVKVEHNGALYVVPGSVSNTVTGKVSTTAHDHDHDHHAHDHDHGHHHHGHDHVHDYPEPDYNTSQLPSMSTPITYSASESMREFRSSSKVNATNYYKYDPNSKSAKVVLTDLYEEEIPCHAHYDYSWDQSKVHPYKYNLATMPETVEFLLTHGFDEDFQMPIHGRLTSKFGPRWGRHHNGIDIDLDKGDVVKAAFKGKVRIAQYSSGYGNLVVIRHYNGLETYYAHLSKLKVKEGDDVDAGSTIGLGGSTGRSTGSHLHFEVRYKGHPIDPAEMIDLGSYRLKNHTFVVNKSYFSSTNPYESAHGGSGGSIYHKVRSGDTLSGIARRYGTSISRICKLNGISSRSTLRVGRRLKVR